MDFDIPNAPPGEYLLGSCHTVPFPPEVQFGFVSAFISRGEITANWSSGDAVQQTTFRADSPIYFLGNASTSGTIVLPLRSSPSSSAMATLTFVNNSKEDGVILVVGGAGFAVAGHQPKVIVYRKLPPSLGSTVNIFYSSPH